MLRGTDIIKLIQLEGLFRQIRNARQYRGTPKRLHRGVDRKLGPTTKVNSIHNLRHAVNKGKETGA